MSASRVYNSPRLRYSDEKPFAGMTRSFRRAIQALATGDYPSFVFNRMEEPVFATHPNLAEAKQRLLERGCAAAAMSGSGPTLFGVCKTKRDATRITETFTDYKTSVVSSVPMALECIQ